MSAEPRYPQRVNTTNYQHPQERNLLDLHYAMQYRPDGSPELRVNSSIEGNIVIEGNVNIPGTVAVDSTAADPVHTHVTEIGTSGILDVPYMPIGGNVNVFGTVAVSSITSNVTVNPITGNVGILGNVSVNPITGNVGILGNVSVNPITGNVGILGNVSVNPITGNVGILGNVSVNPIQGNVGILGNVSVNPITGNVGILGNVSVNPIQGNVGILGNVSVNPITGNVNANVTGGNITVQQGTTPWVVSGNLGVSGTQTVSLGTDSTDAFGRLRVSNPTTLFDTQTRYYNHNQFSSNVSGAGTYTYDSNSSTCALSVGTTNNDSVITESVKVFAYQPGKSLLIYETFCMNTPKLNVRQRVGYFGSQNGIFFEVDGTTYNMVIRSYSSGVLTERRIPQNSWNGDTMLGTGGSSNPSGLTLYPDRTQIFFCDIEWLGVGSVRVGFIINGLYVNCHTFNHANMPGYTTTYMSTACLPLRYEITNTGTSASNSTLRQICQTVISEGGYSLTGTPRSVGHPLASAVALPNTGSFIPVISIRLKSSTPDSIVLPTFYTVAPLAQSNFQYRVYTAAVTTGGTWTSFSSDSPVEYNLAPTSIVSGAVAASSYIIASNQASSVISQVPTGFTYQLARDGLHGTYYEFVIEVCTSGNNQKVVSSIEWQEIN
jgi:hypothetical protein